MPRGGEDPKVRGDRRRRCRPHRSDRCSSGADATPGPEALEYRYGGRRSFVRVSVKVSARHSGLALRTYGSGPTACRTGRSIYASS